MANPTSKVNLVVNGVTTQLDVHDANAVPLAGTNALSGSLIPSTDGTVNLGSSSYQWNNAYIKSLIINGVACGDILTHNANEFVNVSSDQTVGGSKIFSHGQTGVGRDLYHFTTSPYAKNTPPANTSFQYIWFGGNTVSQGFTNSWYGSFIELVINTDGSARGSWVIRNTNDNRMGIQLSQSADGSSRSIIPVGSAIDLGTSTNKWKSFNGINPGALSLPSVSSGINLDLTNFKTDGSDNKFSLTNFSNYPYDNGWLFVRLNGCTYYYLDHWYKVVSNGYANPITAIFFLPINDKDHDIMLRCVCTSIDYIRVFPCQGEV